MRCFERTHVRVCAGPVELSTGRDSGWSRQRGASAIEFLLAAPLVLLLGLAVWQWALILQARQIAEAGVREAARAGSLGHAEIAAIEEGFARGLAPLWLDEPSLGARPTATLQSLSMLAAAQKAGWLSWRQLAPTHESFVDWGVESPQSSSGSKGRVIPSDNPIWRARNAEPTSGRATPFASEARGQASGQTFREAGILRLEITLGVALHVPLAGRFFSWVARTAAGCAGDAPAGVGLLRFSGNSTPSQAALSAVPAHASSARGVVSNPATGYGAPAHLRVGLTTDTTEKCAHFSGPDSRGITQPRLPIRLIADSRMATEARITERTPHRAGSGGYAHRAAYEGTVEAAHGVSGPALSMSSDKAAEPDYQAANILGFDDASSEPRTESATRRPGFLGIGAERELWAPGACGISPS